jgi:hypothetical protein
VSRPVAFVEGLGRIKKMIGTDISKLVKVTFVHMVCADCNEIFGSLVVPYEFHNKVNKVLAETETWPYCKKCTDKRMSESFGPNLE